MTVRTFLVASRVIIDSRSQTVSMIDIVDEITLDAALIAGDEPIMLPVALAAVGFFSDPTDEERAGKPYDFVIRKEDQLLLSQPVSIRFGDHLRSRIVLDFQAMPFVGLGMYKVALTEAGNPSDVLADWDILFRSAQELPA